MALYPADLLQPPPERVAAPRPPLGGTRSQPMQRLQVGLFGLGTMALLVGLANIIGGHADENDASVVADAVPAIEEQAEAPVRDPLADAGVVPDMSVEEDLTTPDLDVPLPQP